MEKLVLLCVVAAVLGHTVGTSVIQSDPVSNWGDWARDFDRCPEGRAVQGFQVLSETSLAIDDTSMNGLKLFCGNPQDGVTPAITSEYGKWGEWRAKYRCATQGYVNGFQLRVEKPGLVHDETATNNIRIFCTTNGDAPIEGDGQSDGAWGNSYHCPAGEVVCGLRTQLESDQGNLLDDTALNNIAMECCPHPPTSNVATFLSKKPTTN